MKVLRSVASVLVSYAAVYLFFVLIDPVFYRMFPGQYSPGSVPPTSLLWICMATFAVASVLGGWLCVWIAPSRPGIHLLALIILGEFAWTVSAAGLWAAWPHWYFLVWMLAVWPGCLGMGALGRKTSKKQAIASIGVS